MKPWGVVDDASEEPGFGKVLWNAESFRKLRELPTSGAQTALEIMFKARDKHGDRRAVGWRKLLKTHTISDGGARREKLELAGEYTWMSYQEYYDRVLSLARGLSLRGVEPNSKVVIYAETQRDWMAMAFAAWYNNAQVVTIYATLGEDGAAHGINETGAPVVVADAKLMKVLLKVLPSCKSVKHVVTLTASEESVVEEIEKLSISIDSVDGLMTKGRTASFSPSMPKPDDVAVIMYTSGTTGPPKGVMISHGNIVSTSSGVEHFLEGGCTDEDVFLAYLPLAHIMEMTAEVCFMSKGCAMGFGNPHTLLSRGDAAKKLFEGCQGDAPLLQPTFMVFPPAVLDKIFQAVNAQAGQLGAIAKTLFRWGVNSGDRHFQKNGVGANWFLNSLVFRKTQALVGGRLKGVLAGSAPLSADVQKFIQTCMRAPVRQGYGLTETCAASCITFWGDNSTRCVGPPTVSTCIRLADWPEGNYMNSDVDKEGVGMPRGEVLIGGPGVSMGYFISESSPNADLAKKNEEDWVTIQGIRYFRTGDVGQITKDGQLQIIDRKKDLWKGPNGEYVSLSKVEQALLTCEFVGLPMCYGRTGEDFPIALICPQRARLEGLADELVVTGDFEFFCIQDEIVEVVTKACRAACKAAKLAEFEIPKRFALIHELWTPENEMLTAAMKLKRPVIAERHKDVIDRLYEA